MQTILLLEPPEGNISEYLTDRYKFVVERLNIETSPFLEAERIFQKMKEQKCSIDGILSFYDFPSIVNAVLAKKLKLSGTSPESVYHAQNKAEFLKKIGSKNIYQAPWLLVNIRSFQNKAPDKKMLFIRPIKGSLSVNAYKVKNTRELPQIYKHLLNKSKPLEEGFRSFFCHFDNKMVCPENNFILQRYIRAKQYTLDGFVFNKKVYFIGIVQSIYTPDRTSFKRFDSPVKFNRQLTAQLMIVARKIIRTLEYGQSGFNMEFFVLPDQKIMPIEFNTRISPGFYNLYKQIYEDSIFSMMADLSVRKMPNMKKKAMSQYASSFPLRIKHDALLKAKPSSLELERLQKKYDAPRIHIYVKEGMRLSDYRQDAYSFRYGLVDVTGKNRKEILKKFSHLMKELKNYLALQK